MKLKTNCCVPILLLIILLAGAGCAKETKVSSTRLIVGGIAGLDHSDGGVLVTGLGPTGIFSKSFGDANLSLDLATGPWNFRVVAWSGPAPMEGVMRCGRFSTTLTKSQEAVSINLSIANCQLPAFGDGLMRNPATGLFSPLRIHTCSDFYRDMVESDYAAMFPIANCDFNKGKERSFRVGFPVRDTPASARTPTPPLISQCVTGMAGGDASILSGIKIPDLGMPVQIMAYDLPGCSGAARVFEFDQGLRQFSLLNDGMARAKGAQTDVFLDSIWCQGAALSAVPFASGAFDATGANIVCTPAQLATLDSAGANYNAAHVNTAGAVIRLGADIDLTGAWNTNGYQISGGVAPAFRGIFEGNKHIISNGTRALFESITNGARVERLTLDYFVVPSGIATGSNKGILSDTISGGSEVRLRFIKILDSQLTPNAGAFSMGIIGNITNVNVVFDGVKIDNVHILGSVADVAHDDMGILVGSVTYSTATTYFSRFEHIRVNNSSVEGYDQVGGLVGRYDDNTSNGGGRSEFRDVLFDDNILIGVSNVGGMVGSFTSTQASAELNFRNVEHTSVDFNTYYMDGSQNVGGLVGSANKRVVIEDSLFYGEIHTSTGVSLLNIGGIAGSLERGTLNNVHTINVIEIDTGASNVSNVGGLAGTLGVFNSTGVKANNTYSSSFINVLATTASLQNIGGVIGKLEGHTPPNNSILSNSLAEGDIILADPLDGQTIGGLVGSVQRADVVRNVSHVNVAGFSIIGGAVGEITDSGNIDQLYITGNVVFDGSSSGGLVGNATTASSTGISNSLYTGDITDNSPTCNGAATCGTLIGEAGSNVNCSNLSTDTGYSYAGGSPNAVGTEVGVTCENAGNIGTTAKASFTPIGGIVDGSGNLIFINHWAALNPALDVAGTSWDPLIIDSMTKWNIAASSGFLLQKGLALGADIDFLNTDANFTPFGGVSPGALKFTGSLQGNGYRLKNINIVAGTSCPTSDCGVIRVLGDNSLMIPGKVGKQGSPLKIENISISTGGGTNNIGSAVGLLSMGDVYAQITNGNISGSAGGGTHSNFGGVVGRMDGGQITNSSFQGTISLNQQFLYLGGIVGSVLLNGNGYHSIRGSYADVTFGSNSNVKGGIIGNMLISGGNPAFYIQDVYALIHGFGANNSGENGGLIGNYDNDGGGTVNLKNAVAIFNTAEVARGTIGELSTTNPGDLSGLNNSTIIAISAGMRVLTPKLGLGVGAAVGLYNTSWSDFEQVNMANFDFMESSMVNDANYPHPRFYWQYPAGTFPMDYDF